MPENDLRWNLLSDLEEDKRNQILAYREILVEYNTRVNLVSRKSIEEVVVLHIDHCLAFNAKIFPPNTHVVDWGTGGGLPGILLAILFPSSVFHLVDSRNRKIEAVKYFAEKLGLSNVEAYATRAEKWEGSVHFAVSRATAPLLDLWQWSDRVLKPKKELEERYWPSGLICLKGGDLEEEVKRFDRKFGTAKLTRQKLSLEYHDGAYQEKELLVATRS